MKATELMVGDYVRHKRTKVVISIFEIDDDRNVINNEPDGYCSERHIEIDNVEPIPLTPEIIEKNGFKEYNGYGYASNKGYCFEGFYINYDFTTRIANIECKFNYVHELQHALKLCGIEKTIEL